MGTHAQALLAALDTACTNVDDLGQASAALFQTHPDHAVITSFPGLADSTGARVLAEIGDDRTRFADARALKAYAGSAPVTRASGARSPSLTAISRTTDSPTSAGCGRSPPPPRTSQPAGTIGCGVRVATATPRPPATYSTSFSANSTTACSTSRPSTGCRPFRRCTTLRPNATRSPAAEGTVTSFCQMRPDTRQRELRKHPAAKPSNAYLISLHPRQGLLASRVDCSSFGDELAAARHTAAGVYPKRSMIAAAIGPGASSWMKCRASGSSTST